MPRFDSAARDLRQIRQVVGPTNTITVAEPARYIIRIEDKDKTEPLALIAADIGAMKSDIAELGVLAKSLTGAGGVGAAGFGALWFFGAKRKRKEE